VLDTALRDVPQSLLEPTKAKVTVRKSYLIIGALLLVVALVLLSSSFSLLAPLSLALGIASGALFGWSFASRSSATEPYHQTIREGEQEGRGFARGRLFEATLSGMREGLVVVDRDMRVVASNASARRLFNPPFSAIDRQSLMQLTRNPAIYSAFLDALKGKERSTVKVETFDVERRVFDLRVVPLKGEHTGDTEGAIGVFFDVTRLERLERVRQEFLSNVSHELRTPLTSILAFVETLESSEANKQDAQRFLEIIRKNASRMSHLIEDILELGAIEAGMVRVQPEVVPLAELVQDVFDSLASKASSQGIDLVSNVSFEDRVYADASRLEQMLTNLIDNAIKFNRSGGRVIVSHEQGERSRIRVEDTGEGIPKQHVDRLFERFYRVDRARSRDIGGTGLGLAIVKHLARAHGGDVSVESKLGEGSAFIIELPGNAELG
jgi:two-component system phosphate regulon sensor histidine kinase PhoR